MRSMGPDRDQREQRQQGRGGAGNGQIRPLPLGFDPEVTPDFFERHLDRPSADEPAQDIQRIGVDIGAQERLGIVIAGDVAHEDVADGHALAGMVPEDRLGHDVEGPPGGAIPAGDDHPVPSRGRIDQPPSQGRLACADPARSSFATDQPPSASSPSRERVAACCRTLLLHNSGVWEPHAELAFDRSKAIG